MRLAVYLLLLLCCLPGVSLQAQDNPFGAIESFWLPDAACALGIGWERIIFDWAQHQPTSADDWYTLNVDDRWLKVANACDREVVAIIKNTPAWATDGLPGVGVPTGLYLPVDDPRNVWANFMRRAAAYYGSRGVRRFIIWNEPDIDRSTYGFEFEGSLDDYFQLLKVASIAARQGNRAAQIHIAGTTYWHDVNQGRRLYLDRLLERIAADPEAPAHNYYFDAVTLHIYFRAETVYEIVRTTRDLLDRYSMGNKSIWIGETNASPNLDPLWLVERPNWQIDLDQQGAFLIQAAALGLAAGADHVGVYKFFDWSLPPGAESFGLIRADESLRPAFDSWRTVIRWMSGVETGSLAQTPLANVVQLERSDGLSVTAVWARTARGTQIEIGATAAKAYLIDQYGSIISIRPFNGRYAISLPGARCNETDGCPVGGGVLLLVQPVGATTIEEVTPKGLVPLVFDERVG